MELFHVLILSLVEGITEFLPISSTGHLILTARILTLEQTEFVKSFEIIIQLGAILSIVVLYWKKFITRPAIWPKVLAGFLPTAIIGYLLYKLIKSFLLGNVMVTLIALLVGGILLILIEKLFTEKDSHNADIKDLSYRNAALIGIFQSFSVIPGVSRSAASIIGGRFMGLKRETAVEYSFFLAVPTMLAASGLDLIETRAIFSMEEYFLLLVGFIGSFITALFAVKFFISYVQKHSFVAFGVYRIMLAILFWLFIMR